MATHARQYLTRLRSVIMMTRNVQTTCNFYSEGLGLRVKHMSQQLAELVDVDGSNVILKLAPSEAFCSPGFSPLLNFEVKEMDAKLKKLKEYGAIVDGDIEEMSDARVVCLRTPDGPMIGLIEYKGDRSVYSDDDDDDKGPQEGTTEADPMKEEIRNILRRIRL
eukprot:TRINITY_DN11351_c0_g1_i1.p2 TRINITY_DN11351_c0_g1~~TRINITY_DN11351_c0_g1_i1.p2  ORF type:complete len:164 (+),score=39.43 TRINITY_DN11351_c0_g1_i1:760-1251(+)